MEFRYIALLIILCLYFLLKHILLPIINCNKQMIRATSSNNINYDLSQDQNNLRP